MRCIVYWTADKLISTEPISAVVDKEQAKEGSLCEIKWKGKGPFLGKIVKISADTKVLREEQAKLEAALLNASGSEYEGQTGQSPSKDEGAACTSLRGRKRMKSRKVLEAEENKERTVIEEAAKSPSPPPLKKAKETIKDQKEGKLSKLRAKAHAQRALCEQFFKETVPEAATSLMGNGPDCVMDKPDIEEPHPKLCNKAEFQPSEYSFTELLNGSEDAGNCLDGVARAVQVLNDDSIVYNVPDESNYEEVDFLRKEVDSLRKEVANLQWLIREKDIEIEQLQLQRGERENTSTVLTSLNGLVVTPRKAKFMVDLSEALSVMTKEANGTTNQTTLTPPSTTSSPGQQQVETPKSSMPSEDCDEKVELVKGTGVYVTVAQLTGIALKGKKGVGVMFRKILETLYSTEELHNGCAVGGRPKAFNKQFDVKSVPLDPKRLSAAKAYVLCFCQKKGLPAPTDTEINSIVNSKCVTVRRGCKQR